MISKQGFPTGFFDVSIWNEEGNIVYSTSLPFRPISSALSMDDSILVCGMGSYAFVFYLNTDRVVEVALPNTSIAKNVSINLTKTHVVHTKVALHQYTQRCWVVYYVLMGSSHSKFSKTSVWDSPDLFADSVFHCTIGMERDMAKDMLKSLAFRCFY